MRVISLANDDVTYQDGGNSYVRGYSEGAQKAWLEKELAAVRGDHDVDWIVVCMHQVAISTVGKFNGEDLGIRLVRAAIAAATGRIEGTAASRSLPACHCSRIAGGASQAP
jgi:3',5'-cyclic AMP phosphodiesterase CpdA